MFIKIAHRGASKKEPENTMRSFRRALSLGFTFIECDAHVCKTGELVVMHDETVNRTTNGRGKIHHKTFKELLELDDGKGEHIPKLQQVVELVHGKARLDIELKGKGTGAAVAYMLAGYYAAGWKPSDFFITSFSKKELLSFRKIDEVTQVGYLVGLNIFGVICFAKKIHAHSINPSYYQVTEHFVRRAHKNGFKVFVYTVDTHEGAEKMKAMGVDGVFSDCPDEI